MPSEYWIGGWKSSATGKWHTGSPKSWKRIDQVKIEYKRTGRDGWFTISKVPGSHLTDKEREKLILRLVKTKVDYYLSRNA